MPEFYIAVLHEKNQTLHLDYAAKLFIESSFSIIVHQKHHAVFHFFDFEGGFKTFLKSKGLESEIHTVRQSLPTGFGLSTISDLKIDSPIEVLYFFEYINQLKHVVEERSFNQFLILTDKTIDKVRHFDKNSGKSVFDLYDACIDESNFYKRKFRMFQNNIIFAKHWELNFKVFDRLSYQFWLLRLRETIKIQFKTRMLQYLSGLPFKNQWREYLSKYHKNHLSYSAFVQKVETVIRLVSQADAIRDVLLNKGLLKDFIFNRLFLKWLNGNEMLSLEKELMLEESALERESKEGNAGETKPFFDCYNAQYLQLQSKANMLQCPNVTLKRFPD